MFYKTVSMWASDDFPARFLVPVDSLLKNIKDISKTQTIEITLTNDSWQSGSSSRYSITILTRKKQSVEITWRKNGILSSIRHPAHVVYNNVQNMDTFLAKILRATNMKKLPQVSGPPNFSEWFHEGVKLDGFAAIEKTPEAIIKYIKQNPKSRYAVMRICKKTKWLPEDILNKMQLLTI